MSIGAISLENPNTTYKEFLKLNVNKTNNLIKK